MDRNCSIIFHFAWRLMTTAGTKSRYRRGWRRLGSSQPIEGLPWNFSSVGARYQRSGGSLDRLYCYLFVQRNLYLHGIYRICHDVQSFAPTTTTNQDQAARWTRSALCGRRYPASGRSACRSGEHDGGRVVGFVLIRCLFSFDR